MTQASWIAVDWGTSCLRAWAMNQADQVLEQRTNDYGMGKLTAAEYEPQLLALVSDWLATAGTTPVLICGMAGSREGWQEAPYLSVPVRLPQQLKAVAVPASDPRLQVAILPGLKQADPADVMRGEETQLAGFLRQQPDFSGVLVLPGTHTKWVRVQDRKVMQFSTAMSGELFRLISEQSILRHSLCTEHWQQAAFEQHVVSALQNPGGFSQRLFGLRAAGLLHGQSGETANAQLSAELIALEIAGMHEYWHHDNTDQIAVIGNHRLTNLYQRALELAGAQAAAYSGEDLVLSGLAGVYQENHL